MTEEEQIMYTFHLKRLGEIIVKRISDELQKVKFLDVYPTHGDMEVLNQLEQRFTTATTLLRQRNLPFGLENVIAELRDIEINLQVDRFDKEQLDEGDYYEFALARHLSEVNKLFPEDTMPHLHPWQDKQLPDAAGPVGGKKKKTKKTRKNIRRSNKKTRKH